MTRLLLVRHGETDWNVQSRYQGHSDVPLNARGRDQAQAVAARLSGEQIDAIYASPLLRAWETAERIAAHHPVEIRREPRLMEMKFGAWEGLTHAEIQQKHPLTPAEWMEMMVQTGAPDGESLLQFSDRVKQAGESILEKDEGDTAQNGSQSPSEGTVPGSAQGAVLLVTHSGVIKVMLCALLGHPLEKYWQFRCEQTSISVVSVHPGGAILERLNDTCHLIGAGE